MYASHTVWITGLCHHSQSSLPPTLFPWSPSPPAHLSGVTLPLLPQVNVHCPVISFRLATWFRSVGFCSCQGATPVPTEVTMRSRRAGGRCSGAVLSWGSPGSTEQQGGDLGAGCPGQALGLWMLTYHTLSWNRSS
jgi:hypothetical protein